MNEDPGWGPALAKPHLFVLFFIAPILVMRARLDGLSRIRMVFVSIVTSLILVCAIATFIVTSGSAEPTDVGMWIGIMIAVGAVTLGLVLATRKRSMSGTDASAVAESYSKNFFLGYALSAANGLVGFVSSFVTESTVPLFIGFAFALLGLGLIAPTRGEMTRRQSQMQADGVEGSFVRALMDVELMR